MKENIKWIFFSNLAQSVFGIIPFQNINDINHRFFLLNKALKTHWINEFNFLQINIKS